MNENFAIPGLMQPEAPNHVTRGVRAAAGDLLHLGTWPLDAALPQVRLFLAASSLIEPEFVLAGNRLADFRSSTRSLSAWMPDDLTDGDWIAELWTRSGLNRRVLFAAGTVSFREIAPSGYVLDAGVQTAPETGEVVDVIWRGMPWSRRVYIRDKQNRLVDLTTYQIWAQLKNRPDGDLLTALTVTLPEGITGAVDVSLVADVTQELPMGYAWWDILFQWPDSELFDRIAPVRVFVNAGVTRDE